MRVVSNLIVNMYRTSNMLISDGKFRCDEKLQYVRNIWQHCGVFMSLIYSNIFLIDNCTS